jgi:hypothetical protein
MQVQLTVSNHLTPWILQGTDDPASPGPLVEGKMQKVFKIFRYIAYTGTYMEH